LDILSPVNCKVRTVIIFTLQSAVAELKDILVLRELSNAEEQAIH